MTARTRTLAALALATGVFAAQAQTGSSTEGAMPQSRAASSSASGADGNKAAKPPADKMSTPMGTSKKPAKAGAQGGGASAPM